MKRCERAPYLMAQVAKGQVDVEVLPGVVAGESPHLEISEPQSAELLFVW